MRTLVVGAGVVGQVYGRHLAKAGAEVAFLVKPRHAEATRADTTLYRLRRLGRRVERDRFVATATYADPGSIGGMAWDQIYLTMSSTALRADGWFEALIASAGAATIVLLQPGPDDRAFVLRHVAEERVVQGIITLIGYRAPLPGETRFSEPGIAYWFPPLASSPMSGEGRRVEPVVEALRRGGLPARRVSGVPRSAAFGAAAAMPLIAELERADWNAGRFRRREHLERALRASRQAVAVVARRTGERAPVPIRAALRPALLQAMLSPAHLLVPFDLSTYLRVHFTKVGDQTRDALQTYVEWGQRAGLPTDEIARLIG
jgi:ketopantoate reductase